MASIMPSGGVDTFTGSNGASFNSTNWVTSLVNGTGSATIQNNAGRIRTGTVAGQRISVRINTSPRRDAEFLFDWTIPSNATAYPRVLMRCLDSALDTKSAYYFTLETNRMEAGIYDASYVGTAISTKAYTGRTAGQVIRTRIAIFGTEAKARSWLASSTEPTTWDIELTSLSNTSNGYFGITQATNDGGAIDLVIDNANLFDEIVSSLKKTNHASSITPQGSLTKALGRRFPASIAPTGTTSVRRVVVRKFSGTITGTTILNDQAGKALYGSTTATGRYRHRAGKWLRSTLAPMGTLRRIPVHRGAGSVAPVGRLDVHSVGRVFGRPGIVVMRVYKAGDVRGRVRRG